MGVQLIGNRFEEINIFKVAKIIEESADFEKLRADILTIY